MKKWIVALLTLAAAMTMSVTAMAAEPEEQWAELDVGDRLIQCGGYPAASAYAVQLCSENWEEAKAALAEGLKNWADSIDIRQYGIAYGDAGTQIGNLYWEVVNENPGLFYVYKSFVCGVTASGIVTTVKPTYDSAFTKADVTIYNNKVNEILSGVDKSWTDFQKALYLHDYLASHGRYDTEYERYNAYNILIEQRGVCQAYTLAYMELLNGVGIGNSTVSSNELNHIWNLVLIGGEWYHVDVTWDDPVNSAMLSDSTAPDRLGHVEHSNFLRNDEAFGKNGHYASDWSTALVCESDKYEDWHGASVNTAFVPLNGKWYYISGYKLTQTDDPETDAGSTVKAIEGLWWMWGKNKAAYWSKAYYALWSWNGQLIHNTPDNKIVGYDPKTGMTTTLLVPDTTNGYLYGFSISGSTATCLLAQNPGDLTGWELKTAALSPYESAGAGQYSTYEKDNTLHLRQDAAGGLLVAARYDGSGRMVELKTITAQYGELSIPLPESGWLKVFALTSSGAPRSAAATWPKAA